MTCETSSGPEDVGIRIKHASSGATRFPAAPTDMLDLHSSREIKVSRTSDVPVYTVWPAEPINVADCFIVPGQEYAIQTLGVGGGPGNEADYSPALPLPTARYGDTQGLQPATPPDGVVNIVDAMGGIGAFQAFPNASVVQYEMGFEVPDVVIHIIDIVYILEAFQGYDYPLSSPEDCP